MDSTWKEETWKAKNNLVQDCGGRAGGDEFVFRSGTTYSQGQRHRGNSPRPPVPLGWWGLSKYSVSVKILYWQFISTCKETQLLRRSIITYSKSLSDIRKLYPKTLGYQKELFRIWEQEFTLDFIDIWKRLSDMSTIFEINPVIATQEFFWCQNWLLWLSAALVITINIILIRCNNDRYYCLKLIDPDRR